MTLNVTTLNFSKLSKTTFNIITLSITTLGIMTLSIMRNTIAHWAHSQVTKKISVVNTTPGALHNLQMGPIS